MVEIFLQIPSNVPSVPVSDGASDSTKILAWIVTCLVIALGIVAKFGFSYVKAEWARKDKIEEERRAEDKQATKELAEERNKLLLKLESGRNSGQAKAIEEITKGFEQLRKDAAIDRGAVGTDVQQLRGLLQALDRRIADLEKKITP